MRINIKGITDTDARKRYEDLTANYANYAI